jgi:hypothetical protein
MVPLVRNMVGAAGAAGWRGAGETGGEVNGERVKCRDGKYCQGTGAASEVTESFG